MLLIMRVSCRSISANIPLSGKLGCLARSLYPWNLTLLYLAFSVRFEACDAVQIPGHARMDWRGATLGVANCTVAWHGLWTHIRVCFSPLRQILIPTTHSLRQRSTPQAYNQVFESNLTKNGRYRNQGDSWQQNLPLLSRLGRRPRPHVPELFTYFLLSSVLWLVDLGRCQGSNISMEIRT